MSRKTLRAAALAAALAAAATAAAAEPVALERWGSFHVGGREVVVSGQPVREVLFSPGGVPARVDPNGTYLMGQMYAQYTVPAERRGQAPVLMWHGGGLTGATWETTPDGRGGWQHFFLRRGWPVVVSDAVERGRSGWTMIPEQTGGQPVYLPESDPWTRFRIGPPGSFPSRAAYPGCQFPADAASYRAFLRQVVPRFTPRTSRRSRPTSRSSTGWSPRSSWRTAKPGCSAGARRRSGRARCARWCWWSLRRWATRPRRRRSRACPC